MECPNCHKNTSSLSPRCGSCGATIPPGQFLLEASGVLGAREPDVAPLDEPPSPPASLPVVAPCPVATLGDRCIAVALDTMVLLAACAVVDAWAFLRWSVHGKAELSLTSASLLIATALNVLIFFAYGWLLEAGFGATLGKAMVGIRVLGDDQRSALAASAIRNLLRMVDGLGFYLVGLMVASCSRRRQRVGDICAGTVVVAPELHAGFKALAIVLWVGALAGASWGVPRICAQPHTAHRLPHLDQVIAQLGRTDSSAYLRVAGFRLEIQRNVAQSEPPVGAQDALSAPVPPAGSD